MRRREQRLAEAISYGAPGDAAPEALLSALRVEETRRKSLEEQLAALPQSTAVVSIDRDYVSRELRARRRCAGRAPPSGSAGTGDASEPSGGSGRLHARARRRRARLRVHRRRHVRRATGGQHLAHYLWWSQRDTNPFVLWNFAELYAPLSSVLPRVLLAARNLGHRKVHLQTVYRIGKLTLRSASVRELAEVIYAEGEESRRTPRGFSKEDLFSASVPTVLWAVRLATLPAPKGPSSRGRAWRCPVRRAVHEAWRGRRLPTPPCAAAVTRGRRGAWS